MSRTGAGRKTGKSAGKGTRRRKAKPSSTGAMWPWYVAGVLIVGGIAAYDNLATVRGWLRTQTPHFAESAPVSRTMQRQAGETHTAAFHPPVQRPAEKHAPGKTTQVLPGLTPPMDVPAVQTVALQVGPAKTFYFCTDQKTNCVIDGANFFFRGQKVALADVSMPQMKKAKCDAERELGSRAKRRLREILNSGNFKLLAANGNAIGNAEGRMHVVLGDGTLISDRLISEGLAHGPKDADKPWC